MKEEYSNVRLKFWDILLDPSSDIWIPLVIITTIGALTLLSLIYNITRKTWVDSSADETKIQKFRKLSIATLIHLIITGSCSVALIYFSQMQSTFHAVSNTTNKYMITNADFELESHDYSKETSIYRGTISLDGSDIRVRVSFDANYEPTIIPNGELPEPKIRTLVRK